METEVCYACRVGWHAECVGPAALEETSGLASCCCRAGDIVADVGALSPGIVGTIDTRRASKPDDEILDQTSTGRKRAAAMYPIPSVAEGGMICEWAWLANAGGGVLPIVGCQGNRIADIKEKIVDDTPEVIFWPGNIHHGPDKSTLNNDPGNVHRICPVCHNRWHTLNDGFYGKRPDGGKPFIPLSGDLILHDKDSAATTEEIEYHEEYWKTPAKIRNSLPYRKVTSDE